MDEHKVDYIECPHCAYKHTDYHDLIEVGDLGGNFEMDCDGCGEHFKVDFYSVFYFQSEK